MIGRAGQYELLQRLAMGGIGEVFLARHESRGTRAAVKRLHAHYQHHAGIAAMFRHEGALLAAMDHPNVTRLYESGVYEGLPYMALEFAPGVDAGLIERTGEPPPLAGSIALVLQLLAALAHAHGCEDHRGRPLGVVHRDVTPANLIVGLDGSVKLIDFGIATSAERADDAAGALRGTPGYMPAELITGAGTVDQRVDVFGAGAVLYEATLARRAFPGSMIRAANAVVEGELEVPSSVRADYPRALERVVLRALARHPEDRFASAGAMAVALADAARAIECAPSREALAVWLANHAPTSAH